ncbi:MAG: hypothetical protein RIQ96_574, partial [Pseudomonadota bacterium]
MPPHVLADSLSLENHTMYQSDLLAGQRILV